MILALQNLGLLLERSADLLPVIHASVDTILLIIPCPLHRMLFPGSELQMDMACK
jgi:hypothetical protein